jgi:hypothetical protein
MRGKANPKCQCASLPSSLHESEMPGETRASLAILIDAQEFVARCLVCPQYWEFGYFGRHDIPTYAKLSSAEARARVKAWDEAEPEREAWAAQYAEEKRAEALEFEAQGERLRQAEAKLNSPLSRAFQVGALLCFAIGTVAAYWMIITDGEPPPGRLAFASAALFAGIALGGCYALRNR